MKSEIILSYVRSSFNKQSSLLSAILVSYINAPDFCKPFDLVVHFSDNTEFVYSFYDYDNAVACFRDVVMPY